MKGGVSDLLADRRQVPQGHWTWGPPTDCAMRGHRGISDGDGRSTVGMATSTINGIRGGGGAGGALEGDPGGPAYAQPLSPLTPSASLNGICNRQ